MMTGHFENEDKAQRKVAGMLGIIMFYLVMAAISWAGEHGDIEKGKVIYQESCRHCHGLAGQGDGEMGEYLDPRPANLASPGTQIKSDQELNDVILKGRTGTSMAGFEGALDDNQLNDLIAFLRSLKP